MSKKNTTSWYSSIFITIIISFSNTVLPTTGREIRETARDVLIFGLSSLGSLAGWSILAKKLYDSSLNYTNPQSRLLLKTLSFLAASPLASLTLSTLTRYLGHKEFININQKTENIIGTPLKYLVTEPIEKLMRYLQKQQPTNSP